MMLLILNKPGMMNKRTLMLNAINNTVRERMVKLIDKSRWHEITLINELFRQLFLLDIMLCVFIMIYYRVI